jgi:hypothetical protein
LKNRKEEEEGGRPFLRNHDLKILICVLRAGECLKIDAVELGITAVRSVVILRRIEGS